MMANVVCGPTHGFPTGFSHVHRIWKTWENDLEIDDVIATSRIAYGRLSLT